MQRDRDRAAAGDKFTSCNDNTDQNISNYLSGSINYLSKQGDEPNCVTYDPNNHTHDVDVSFGTYGGAQECPSKISTGGDDIIALQTKLSAAKLALNSSEVLLAIWKNGGDAELKDKVETTLPWDVYLEFNHLIAESPYLSEDVLLATIENPAFTSLMIKLIMIANPHAKKNREIMEAIYKRIPEISKSYIDAINAGSNTETQLEILLANVSADKHLISTVSNNIKRVYRSDYEDNNAINKLISFVNAENTLASRYELASLYLETKLYDNMNTVFDNIYSDFDLKKEQIVDLNNWQSYYSIAQAYKEADGNISTLNKSQITSLENLMNLNRPYISSAAVALLLANNPEYSYNEVVLPIKESSARMANPFHEADNEVEDDNILNIYPNPSHDYITLAYRTGSKYSKLWVVISDARGGIQMQKTLQGGDNEEIINISDLAPNIYTLILYGDYERISVEKITVIK